MALNNGKFSGGLSGKNLTNYSNKLNYSIKDYTSRKEFVEDILNLDKLGSKDDFWQDVWDIGVCSTSLKKSDTLWSDTNVCMTLESIATYLLNSDSHVDERFNRPKKEVVLNENMSIEDYIVAKNDKNYRLAPSDEVKNKDFFEREIFKYDYEYYSDVLYPRCLQNVGEHCKCLSKDNWENLKRFEKERISFLKDAKDNLLVLNEQNKAIKDGAINFREFHNNKKQVDDLVKRIVPLNVQLKKYGLDNASVKDIEQKSLYKTRDRNYSVTLKHITENISDVKDYMNLCKLAYINRVCIDAGKNPVNSNILDNVDYSNIKHIAAILYLNSENISYENDISIIAYDITKAIRELRKLGKLDDKDMYIIEGIRHSVTQEDIACELNISKQAVNKRIFKISKKIIDFLN